ncbi:hypothetical protein ABPG72_015453 [Tetrahymena utriculariae]
MNFNVFIFVILPISAVALFALILIFSDGKKRNKDLVIYQPNVSTIPNVSNVSTVPNNLTSQIRNIKSSLCNDINFNFNHVYDNIMVGLYIIFLEINIDPNILQQLRQISGINWNQNDPILQQILGQQFFSRYLFSNYIELLDNPNINLENVRQYLLDCFRNDNVNINFLIAELINIKQDPIIPVPQRQNTFDELILIQTNLMFENMEINQPGNNENFTDFYFNQIMIFGQMIQHAQKFLQSMQQIYVFYDKMELLNFLEQN